MDLKQTDIWPFETGITDYPIDPVNLALPSIADIANRWAEARFEVGETDRLRTFIEQLNREWSIETGIIENLYDIERGVTQTLIEQGFQASLIPHGATNKDPEFVIALLNDQKAALEGLFAFVKQDLQLTTSYIKVLHAVTTRSQDSVEAVDSLGNLVQAPLLRGQWKAQPNYPQRDGVIYRYCPPEQVPGEMERLVEMHARHREAGVAPDVEAGWLHHRFSQVHPFQDGNGRVARLLASLVLLRAGLFPMVVPRDEKDVYIETLESADRGDLQPLVYLIARRQQVAYEKAIRAVRKHAPDRLNVDEAAKAFRTAFDNLDSVRRNRIEHRSMELHQELVRSFKPKVSQLNRDILGKSDTGTILQFGGGGFGAGNTNASPSADRILPAIKLSAERQPDERIIEAARKVLLKRWSTVASAPYKVMLIEMNNERQFTFMILEYASNPEISDDLQVAAMVISGGDYQPLEIEPLLWPEGSNITSFNDQIKEWRDLMLSTAFGWARRNL